MGYRNRNGLVIFKQTASSNLQVGVSYKVNVRPPGAVASGVNTVTSIPVYAGHGFEAGDKLIVGTSLANYREVTVAAATTLTVDDAVTTAAGDVLINLGDDTGGVSPMWDSTDAPIYSVPDNAVELASSLVTTSPQGEYSYWIGNYPVWEIIRDSSGVIQQVLADVFLEGLDTPTTTVDNAILRAVGTDGREFDTATSNSPTIGDTGAVLIPSTLDVTGATTLSALGVSSGATIGTSLTVGTTLTASGATTVDDTLHVTGAVTLDSTLAAGASTLASAAVTGNITGNAHLRGGSTDVTITVNPTAVTTADCFLINLTSNNAATNVVTLNAPSSVDGKILVLRVAALTAGTLQVADSGNCVLSAAWDGNGVGDTLTLIANGVLWYELARANNA